MGIHEERKIVGYARVSSRTLKDDLERQIEAIKSYARENGWQVEISKVIITYPDRLTRFGFKTLEELFKSYGVEIVVINRREKTRRKELWDYRAFAVKHNYDVKDLLLAYTLILIEAINVIWKNIEWKVKKVRKHYRIKDAGILKNKELKKALRSRKTKYRAKKDCIKVEYEVERLMPGIPASREFKRALRDQLMKEWQKSSGED